jgi:8-oxo-dGTP pyrophosphatase MutT (NUDIX family)
MDRHITVSAFVVHEGRVALHWHRKLGAWLPAGGHLEPGEDPLEAALRELHEEFDVVAEVLPLAPRVEFEGGPRQIEPPFTILNCSVAPDHEHIDHVYFCRLVSGYPGRSYDPDSPVFWLDAADLERGVASNNGVEVAIPPDVQALGLAALRLAASPAAAGAR